MDPEKHVQQRRDWARVMYHFDEACRCVLTEDGERVSIEEVQARFRDEYGVKPRPETIAKANRQLATEHGVAPLSIYVALNPEYYGRVGRHRPGSPRVWQRGTCEPPPSRARHGRSPGVTARRKAYNTKYVRAMRKLRGYLRTLSAGGRQFSLSDLVSTIEDGAGITPSERTVHRRLRRYIDAGCPRGPHIQEIDGRPGAYRVSSRSADRAQETRIKRPTL